MLTAQRASPCLLVSRRAVQFCALPRFGLARWLTVDKDFTCLKLASAFKAIATVFVVLLWLEEVFF